MGNIQQSTKHTLHLMNNRVRTSAVGRVNLALVYDDRIAIIYHKKIITYIYAMPP